MDTSCPLSYNWLMRPTSVQKISLLCITINLLLIATIFLLRKNLPPLIPLFYGLPVSQSQLSPLWGLAIPESVAIGLIVINEIISKLTKDTFLEKILLSLSVAVTVLSTITVLKIIFLIGSF